MPETALEPEAAMEGPHQWVSNVWLQDHSTLPVPSAFSLYCLGSMIGYVHTQFGDAEVLSYRLHGLSKDIKCAITLSSSSFCLVGQKLQVTGVLWPHFAVRSTVLLVLSAQRGADL